MKNLIDSLAQLLIIFLMICVVISLWLTWNYKPDQWRGVLIVFGFLISLVLAARDVPESLKFLFAGPYEFYQFNDGFRKGMRLVAVLMVVLGVLHYTHYWNPEYDDFKRVGMERGNPWSMMVLPDGTWNDNWTPKGSEGSWYNVQHGSIDDKMADNLNYLYLSWKAGELNHNNCPRIW